MLAADHVIADQRAFTESVMKAVPLAREGKLVTFGVAPVEPNTGYGYIEVVPVDDAFKVVSFKEKPDADTARQYVADGCYYWNSGIFLFKVSAYLKRIEGA